MMLKLRTNGFGYACSFYFNCYKGTATQILSCASKVPHATNNSNDFTVSVHHCLSEYTKATEQETTRVPFVRDRRAQCREPLQSSDGLTGEWPGITTQAGSDQTLERRPELSGSENDLCINSLYT